MRSGLVFLVVTGLLACSDAGESPDAGPADAAPTDAPASSDLTPDAKTCPSYAAPVENGVIESAEINETSGLEVSGANPGVLWLHNDSGDTARVFAIDTSAKLLGTYTLEGAVAGDWEDMALGPGPEAGQSYLYIGDIGDNQEHRPTIQIRRVKEPAVSTGQSPVTETLTGVESIVFDYPDGPHNAETMLVDPKNGDLYIVIKTDAATAGVYRSEAPQTPGAQRTLAKVGDVGLGALITGGDIAADGSEILLRTYQKAYLYQRAAGATVADALATSPCEVPAADEGQGETIAFVPVTKDYYTLSEGISQPLYFYKRN